MRHGLSVCVRGFLVVEEAKHRDLRAFKRIQAMCGDSERHCLIFSNEHHRMTYVERVAEESVNDRNDRAIRAAAR